MSCLEEVEPLAQPEADCQERVEPADHGMLGGMEDHALSKGHHPRLEQCRLDLRQHSPACA